MIEENVERNCVTIKIGMENITKKKKINKQVLRMSKDNWEKLKE